MPNSKAEPFRFVNSLIIIFLFLLSAGAFFGVAWRGGQEPVSARALTEREVFVKNTVSLREEVARFLDVYFNQKNLVGADRQQFVLTEYWRFSGLMASNEPDRLLWQRFTATLGALAAQYEAAEPNLTATDESLLAFYHEIK